MTRHRVSELTPGGFTYLTPYSLTPGQPSPGITYPPASPHRYPHRVCYRFDLPKEASPRQHPDWVWRDSGGTGISTGCASTTPYGLALAPDLPWADEPSPGTLGHSAEGFLPPLSLLMPAFALEYAPRPFTRTLRCWIRRSPTHPSSRKSWN